MGSGNEGLRRLGNLDLADPFDNGGREIAEYKSYDHRIRIYGDRTAVQAGDPLAVDVSVQCTCGLTTKPKRTSGQTWGPTVESARDLALAHADKAGREEWARRHPGMPYPN